MCVCERACVRAYVRACVRVCVCVCVCARARALARGGGKRGGSFHTGEKGSIDNLYCPSGCLCVHVSARPTYSLPSPSCQYV